MAYYITEPLGGSDDVVVSVYKNTGEYVGNIIVDRYKWRMSSDEETRYSIDQFKAENADSKHPAVDCGENTELFKALAAMTDGPECTEQYLMATANLYVLKRGKVKQLADKGELLHNDVIVKCGGVFSSLRKATAEEIVEYFKNKER